MTPEPGDGMIPAVLIHGWNSHPGIWNKLTPRLAGAGIPVWKFDHTGLREATLTDVAVSLGEFLVTKREETGYSGYVDFVCHSLGTCAARYLLEVLDASARRERVRQLIGIGPPNNGSALAELFSDPHRRTEIIRQLSGVFVPEGFDPMNDRIVQDVRPGSEVMRRLRTAGTRPDITYRVIVTANPGGEPSFFPLFGGRTWVQETDGRYSVTLEGDGIVANRESALPGVSLDIISGEITDAAPLPQAGQYCHINLPRNPQVMERVIQYLTLKESGT